MPFCQLSGNTLKEWRLLWNVDFQDDPTVMCWKLNRNATFKHLCLLFGRMSDPFMITALI
jgi:hypothetical protein